MAKFRQNHHSRRIRRIRQNCRFVGTPILSSIDLWQNFVKIAILAEFPRFIKIAASSVPHLELNRSMAKFVKIAILAEFAGFVKIAALSVPLSRAQLILGKISSKSPFLPNSPDSSKSPLCRYPYLDLNPSLAKFRQNRHSRRICRIRQNRRFVGTPILSSIALWRNSSKSPFLPNSPDSSKSPLRLYPYLELNRSSAKFVKIAILAEFAGFVKIAALSVPLS